MRTLILLAALTASQTMAQDGPPVLVSDPAMCDMIARGEDTQETGMILTAEGMYEIEYNCEFATPIDLVWQEHRTIVRAGYCAGPGYISPTVFAIQLSDYEPGVVHVWQQGLDDVTDFQRCFGQ